MARPTKTGIKYFSLDVDIFEDEKVIPISSEFGAKGECVLIRVLCAIYRNGYFVQCSEPFKFKIAKQANVPHALVSEVIARLVKWGFFDKIVFDSFGVLTSKGIQSRWKEATRKRVPQEDLEFWLDGFPIEESKFPAEETPLKPPETPQIKLNKTKLKEKIYMSEISETEIPDEYSFLKIAFSFWSLFRKITLEAKSKTTTLDKAKKEPWENDVRLMLEKREASPEDLRTVYTWLNTRETKSAKFWGKIIKSTSNLREHLPKILEQIHSEKPPEPSTVQPSANQGKKVYPGNIFKK